MKKLLFTLAALFMVGTAVADDYWYIDDFEVPQSAVNTNITVTVKAHFDNAVSAAQIDFTLPDGLVLRKIDKGTDFTTLTYHDDWGDEWLAEQTVFVGAVATANVGWAFADMDYYQVDGTWVEAGCVKFLAGEYTDQIVLTIRVTADFQGGKINVHSEPSCSYDLRPDVVPCPEGQKIDKECNVTLEGATPQPQDCEAPVIDWTVNPGAVVVTVTPDEATDGNLVYDGEYSYERKAEAYTVHVTAYTEATANFNQSPLAEKDIEVPALETARTPEITYSYENGQITVWAYGSQEGNTYTLIGPDGVEHENNYTFSYDIYEGYDQVWKAYATGTYMQQSATAEKQVVVEATQYETPKPTVTINDEANPTTITVTGEGTVTLYVNQQAVMTGTESLTYTIEWPAYGEGQEQFLSVYATALNTEYEDAMPGVSSTQYAYVGVQAAQWQDVAAPVISTTKDDDNVYVTIEWPTTTGEKVYTGEYTYARGEDDATYDVEAYTTANYPYNESAHATATIEVPKKEQVTPPDPGETKTFVKVTAADQLVAGKNYIIVAGNKAMGVEATGNFLTAIDITAGDEVEVGDNVAIMTLAGTLGHYTLALGDQYLHAANSTSLDFGTATEWAISDYNGTLDGYRVKHADYNRAVRYSAGYNRFGNYSTSDQNSDYGWIYVEKTETPALQDLTGQIVVSQPDANGVVTVTYNGTEDVTITVNGNPVAESYQLEDGVPMEFNVVVSAEGYNDLTATETRTWNKPVPQQLQGEIVFSEVNQTNGTYSVTYNGPEEGVLVEVIDVVPKNRTDYTLPGYGTYTVTARATKDGYEPLEKSADLTWNKPVVVVGQPVLTGYTQDGITGYGVNITTTTADSEVMYRVYLYDEETGEWVALTEWTEYEGTENEIWYTEEGKYRVDAYAFIGDDKSDTASYEFVVQNTTPTSIDEMNAGKTIAGVRYFNMAGQEMQEANGVTIVVTTYTDGTTSAVKVMK